MLKRLSVLLSVLCLLAVPQQSMADDCGCSCCCEISEGAYLGGYAGGTWFNDLQARATDQDGQIREFEHDWGWTVGIYFGWRFCSGLRIEGDVAYRECDIDKMRLYDGSSVSLTHADDSEITTVSYLVNFIKDCTVDICGCCWRPYFGAGFGVANFKLQFDELGGSFHVDDNSTRFAYQLIIGLAYPWCEGDLGVEYRYFSTSQPEFDIPDAQLDIRNWTSAHAIVVSYKWTFAGLFPL